MNGHSVMIRSGRFQELFHYRTILKNFLKQDIKIKYRRSFLGFLWSLLNPILMMAVITTAFSFMFNRPEGYTLHLLATLLPWICFSQALESSSRSIISSENYLRQLYFPKLVFPLRRTLFSFCEYIFSLLALFVVFGFIGFRPTPALLILPFSIVVLLCFTLGLGCLGAVIVVYFRDAEHLIGVATRAWFYLTPILIPYDEIPARFQKYFALNPMYYVLEMFDAPISRGVLPSPEIILISTVLAMTACLFGLTVFFKMEDGLIFRL